MKPSVVIVLFHRLFNFAYIYILFPPFLGFAHGVAPWPIKTPGKVLVEQMVKKSKTGNDVKT